MKETERDRERENMNNIAVFSYQVNTKQVVFDLITNTEIRPIASRK
jgi:hypothetical protein